MSVGEQTLTQLRQDQVTLSPTSQRRLPNAGGLPAGCSEKHFR